VNHVRNLSPLIAGALLAATASQAAVTGARGNAQIVAPPASVAPDATQGPAVMAFDERQDIVTTAPIQVDLWGPALPASVQAPADLSPGVIPQNACVRSHYIHFDPDVVSQERAAFEFDADILGIIVTQANLDASAGMLGNPGTQYPDGKDCGSTAPTCGLELGFAAGVPGTDRFQARNLAATAQIRVELEANTPADNIRVITEGVCP
jgi:hypothetical protein